MKKPDMIKFFWTIWAFGYYNAPYGGVYQVFIGPVVLTWIK